MSDPPSSGFGDDFFSSVIDAAPDGLLIVDEEGRILLANRHASELFGYDHADLVRLSVDQLLPESLRAAHPHHRQEYAAEPRVRPMGIDLHLLAARADGSEFPVEISLSPLYTDDRLLVVAVVRDITACLQVEERLGSSEAALRDAEQAIAIGEDRERIARDLHDTVIQRLFASGLQLQAVIGRVDDEVRGRIDVIVDGLDETIRDLRTAIFALQAPAAHDQGGMRGELLRVADEASGALGFEPRLQFEGAIETIESPVREHVVPVVREALTNVARHARAGSARVIIAVGDVVVVTVIDNGVGTPEDVVGGRGMKNLADRAAQLGGTFEVKHGPAGGTTVEWRAPFSLPNGAGRT
ncbi:MAG: sensor histidine kinase [Acidimicrobiales bacterium]